MGNKTTFTALQDTSASTKVFLVEVQPGQSIIGWTATGGTSDTYDVDYLYETITLSDGSTTEKIRKSIVDLQEDGVSLTEQNSIANVDANAGSFWHDTANEKLYVHPIGSDDPNTHTLLGLFWLYFSTIGTKAIINSQYYEPYISTSGIPSISQSNSKLYWGLSPIGGGTLKFDNNRGYFDQISKGFIWVSKTVKILLGGDDLPYNQYQTIYTGTIDSKNFTRVGYNLNIKSSTKNLLRTLPINKFWTSNYPNLYDFAEGTPIPIYYGIYDANQAPIATLINDSYGVNTYQFKICDHAIKDITQVYIDYKDGVGWQTIVHGNEDLANATFTIVAANYVAGTSQVKVALEGKHTGGTLIQGAPEIVEDLLTDANLLGFTSADLNTTSFTQSKSDSDVQLNVYVEKETSANTIISTIAASDLGFFDEDEDGKFRYRTWVPQSSTTDPKIEDIDIIGVPTIKEDNSQLYYQVKIGYGFSLNDGKYIYTTETDNESYYLYGRKERLPLNTYIRSSSDATILAQRLLLLVKTPVSIINMNLKIPIVDKLIGDKVKLTLSRAMIEDSGGYDDRVFEISTRRIQAYPVINNIEAFDLREFGSQIGYWTNDAAPVWNSATSSDKGTSGYWLDANGYAEPTDSTSLNVSKWW